MNENIESKIEQLETYKLKERFSQDDFEDREFDYPSPQKLVLMEKEVQKFANFLIGQLKANVSNLQTQVQLYFNAWDNEDFTQDETELIVEMEYEAMRIVELKIEKLMI